MIGGEVVDPSCLWLALALFLVGVVPFVPGVIAAVRRGPLVRRARFALYPPRQRVRHRVRVVIAHHVLPHLPRTRHWTSYQSACWIVGEARLRDLAQRRS